MEGCYHGNDPRGQATNEPGEGGWENLKGLGEGVGGGVKRTGEGVGEKEGVEKREKERKLEEV